VLTCDQVLVTDECIGCNLYDISLSAPFVVFSSLKFEAPISLEVTNEYASAPVSLELGDLQAGVEVDQPV
jgi:hypothetical protein